MSRLKTLQSITNVILLCVNYAILSGNCAMNSIVKGGFLFINYEKLSQNALAIYYPASSHL